MRFPEGKNMVRVKASNQSAILRTIYYYEPVNRAEIAQRIDLTIPAVTTTISKMLEHGIIRETFPQGRGAGLSGRHARPLAINPEAFCFGGVEMKGSSLNVCITDFCGKILASADGVLKNGEYDSFVRQISGHFMECLAAGGKTLEEMGGIGISMPGRVDREKGVLKISALYQWRDKKVCSDFARTTGYKGKVTLENNAIARGTGAQLFHKDGMENGKSFAYLLVSAGIACPLFLNTSSYRGSVVGAGEVGHMAVEAKGRPCNCGSRGCLEAYASETSIINDCKEKMRSGGAGLLRELCADADAPEIAEILKAQEAGDADVRRIVEDAVCMLGIAVTNMVNFTSPDIMLIDCQLFTREENRKLLLEYIGSRQYDPSYFETEISFVESDGFAGALGAAAIAIDERLETCF